MWTQANSPSLPSRGCWINERLGQPCERGKVPEVPSESWTGKSWRKQACPWAYNLGLSPRSCLLSWLSVRNVGLAVGCLCESQSISSHPTSAHVPGGSQDPWPPVHRRWVICLCWALSKKGGQSVSPLTRLHSTSSTRLSVQKGTWWPVTNTCIVPYLSLCLYWLRNPFLHVSLSMISKKQTQRGHHPLERFWWGEGERPWKDKEKGRGIRDIWGSLPAELQFSQLRKMWDLVGGASACSELWEHLVQADSEPWSKAYPLTATYLLREWTGASPAHPPPSCSQFAWRDRGPASLMTPHTRISYLVIWLALE